MGEVFVLAQALTEGAVGAAGIAVGALATVAVVLAKKVRVGNGKSNGRQSSLCPVHQEFAAKLDERHKAISDSLGEIKSGITTLHQRLDAMK